MTGSVAADERHHPPWGVVHGGLFTTVIETFATTGAYEKVKDQGQQAVGVNSTTDRLPAPPHGRQAERRSRRRCAGPQPTTLGTDWYAVAPARWVVGLPARLAATLTGADARLFDGSVAWLITDEVVHRVRFAIAVAEG